MLNRRLQELVKSNTFFGYWRIVVSLARKGEGNVSISYWRNIFGYDLRLIPQPELGNATALLYRRSNIGTSSLDLMKSTKVFPTAVYTVFECQRSMPQHILSTFKSRRSHATLRRGSMATNDHQLQESLEPRY